MPHSDNQHSHWHDHWQEHAKQWSQIGSPLRPCAQDVSLIASAIAPCGTHGLLLGVTPELAAISPHITAIDHNEAMIANVASSKAIFGQWQQLPFDDNQFDFAIGDGSLNVLQYPHDYQAVFAQLKRVLKPEALFVLRLFATPEKCESVADVAKAAFSGSIGSFHAFKWRLAMVMVAASDSPNIRVEHIHKTFEHHFPDRDALAQASGWPRPAIDTIDVYRASTITYSFPTLTQLRELSAPYWALQRAECGSYELAERCPILTFSHA